MILPEPSSSGRKLSGCRCDTLSVEITRARINTKQDSSRRPGRRLSDIRIPNSVIKNLGYVKLRPENLLSVPVTRTHVRPQLRQMDEINNIDGSCTPQYSRARPPPQLFDLQSSQLRPAINPLSVYVCDRCLGSLSISSHGMRLFCLRSCSHVHTKEYTLSW